MKFLRIILENSILFKNGLTIDFINADQVRSRYADSEYILPAYKFKSGIYSQVLLAFTGLNATGKTTMLELLSAIMQVVMQGKGLNDVTIRNVWLKIFPQMYHENMKWSVYFLHEQQVYKLESTISLNHEDENLDEIGFYYKDEHLWIKKLEKVTRKTLFDFTTYEKVINRKDEEKNPYLKDDVSIASSLQGAKGFIRPLGHDTNFNYPAWIGMPSKEAVHVFDPNIKQLRIYPDKKGDMQSVLEFENQEEFQYNGSPLELTRLLSSGTIKGLTLLPGTVKALQTGGYVFIDEIENHFNKKIIEWFFRLFTDKRTNPHGACLIFSTHYPELLDYFTRKDNIYITRRTKENQCECVRYSDFIKRNELSKSRVILENVIGGTAPRFMDLQEGRQWIQELINKGSL